MIIKNFNHLVRILFIDRHLYKEISDNEKEKWFFILNQNISRILPKQAEFLNDKRYDKSMCMDLYVDFLEKKRISHIPKNIYPDWSIREKKEKVVKEKIKKVEYFKLKQKK